MIAAIELGGTKTVVAIGTADGEIIEEHRLPTTTPEETMGAVCNWLRERGTPYLIGVAAFGPVQVDRRSANYGRIGSTPKPGWTHFSLVESLEHSFPGVEIALDTDVNAAVLAEARLGAAAGCDDAVYITIGTGIGAGILTGGRLVHGALHPEFGHFKVPRRADDSFAGVCPFHRDCLEGMASGPSMSARWEKAAHEMPPEHPAWDLEANYLALGILSLAAIVCPAKVVVGGGVSQSPGLHARIQEHLIREAGGYYPQVTVPDYIVPPKLGQQAGIRGALLLTGFGA